MTGVVLGDVMEPANDTTEVETTTGDDAGAETKETPNSTDAETENIPTEIEVVKNQANVEIPSPEQEKANRLELASRIIERARAVTERAKERGDLDMANLAEDLGAGAERFMAITNDEDPWQGIRTRARTGDHYGHPVRGFRAHVGKCPNGSSREYGEMLPPYADPEVSEQIGIVAHVGHLIQDGKSIRDEARQKYRDEEKYENKKNRLVEAEESVISMQRYLEKATEILQRYYNEFSPKQKAALREDMEYVIAYAMNDLFNSLNAEELANLLDDRTPDGKAFDGDEEGLADKGNSLLAMVRDEVYGDAHKRYRGDRDVHRFGIDVRRL